LQFGLPFSAVRVPSAKDRPSALASLNRTGPLGPELLMRLGLTSVGIGAAMPADCARSRRATANTETQATPGDRTDSDDLQGG